MLKFPLALARSKGFHSDSLIAEALGSARLWRDAITFCDRELFRKR